MDVVFWHVEAVLGLLYVIKKKWYRKVKRMTAQKMLFSRKKIKALFFKNKDKTKMLSIPVFLQTQLSSVRT